MTSITTTTTSMEIENDTIVEMMKLLKESTWNIKEVLELFTTSSQNAIRNRKTNKLSTVIVCIKYWNAYGILHNHIISRA